MPFEFFKKKEDPESAVPKDIREKILSLWNSQGVLHHLKDTKALAEDNRERKKDLIEEVEYINRTLEEQKISADTLAKWMAFAKPYSRKGSGIDGLLWIEASKGHASVELNHFYPIRDVVEKAKLFAEMEKIPGKFYLPLLNGFISDLAVPPAPGELERWLHSTKLNQYYRSNAGKLELKEQ